MGNTTAIQWTDKTWNPWMGCQKVSAGCKNCYMYREMKRYDHDADPRLVRRSKTTFTEPLRWRDPAMVFTCSWSDFFIEEADGWRDEAWDIIRRTPHLTYQVLTKRPERIADHLPSDWGEGWKNVWLGTSVEDQAAADKRIPELFGAPARTMFLSCEPLLGPLDLAWHLSEHTPGTSDYLRLIDWVIVGGESGEDARPMHPDWARGIRDQCKSAGVKFFFKQAGGDRRIDGHWGGNLLDGNLYQEWPEVVQVAPPEPPTQLSLF